MDRDGQPIDTIVVGKFTGRLEGGSHFKRGDIVEVFEFGQMCLSIIAATPRTDAEYLRRKNRFGDTYCLDESDDCYIAYELGEGDTHRHPSVACVFPLTKPVSPALAKKLRQKLQELDDSPESLSL